MRKHGTITACAGVGRLPPIPNRRERARAAKPSERRPPFWKARSRRQELQGPQVPRRRQTQKRQRRIALSIPHLSCGICTFERGSPARNRAFFIKSGGGREKSGRLPGNRNATDLALCLQVVRGHTAQGGDGVFRGLPVDEFCPISGRSPLLFCHGRSQRQRLLGRAACRAEQPRAVGDARRTCRLPQSRARAAPRGWRRASNHRAQSRRCVGSRQPARSRRRWSQIVQAGVGRRSPRPDAVGQNDDITRSNTAKHLFAVSPQTASVVWGNAD